MGQVNTPSTGQNQPQARVTLQDIIDHINANKDDIKQKVADQTGTSVKEVEQTLPKIQQTLMEMGDKVSTGDMSAFKDLSPAQAPIQYIPDSPGGSSDVSSARAIVSNDGKNPSPPPDSVDTSNADKNLPVEARLNFKNGMNINVPGQPVPPPAAPIPAPVPPSAPVKKAAPSPVPGPAPAPPPPPPVPARSAPVKKQVAQPDNSSSSSSSSSQQSRSVSSNVITPTIVDAAKKMLPSSDLQNPQDMTNEEKITMALVGTLPILIGTAFQGYQGGAIGGAVANTGVNAIGKALHDRNQQKYDRAQKDIKNSQNQAALDRQSKALENTMSYHEQQLELMRQRNATANKNASANQIKAKAIAKGANGGKILPGYQASQLSPFKSGMKALDDFETAVRSNGDILGPWEGTKASLNPNNTRGQVFKSLQKKLVPLIGSGMEGGKLTEQQHKYWENYVGGMGQTQPALLGKIEVMRRAMIQKHNGDVSTLSGLGYNTGKEQITPETKSPDILHPKPAPVSTQFTAPIQNAFVKDPHIQQIADENKVSYEMAEHIMKQRALSEKANKNGKK